MSILLRKVVGDGADGNHVDVAHESEVTAQNTPVMQSNDLIELLAKDPITATIPQNTTFSEMKAIVKEALVDVSKSRLKQAMLLASRYPNNTANTPIEKWKVPIATGITLENQPWISDFLKLFDAVKEAKPEYFNDQGEIITDKKFLANHAMREKSDSEFADAIAEKFVKMNYSDRIKLRAAFIAIEADIEGTLRSDSYKKNVKKSFVFLRAMLELKEKPTDNNSYLLVGRHLQDMFSKPSQSQELYKILNHLVSKPTMEVKLIDLLSSLYYDFEARGIRELLPLKGSGAMMTPLQDQSYLDGGKQNENEEAYYDALLNKKVVILYSAGGQSTRAKGPKYKILIEGAEGKKMLGEYDLEMIAKLWERAAVHRGKTGQDVVDAIKENMQVLLCVNDEIDSYIVSSYFNKSFYIQGKLVSFADIVKPENLAHMRTFLYKGREIINGIECDENDHLTGLQVANSKIISPVCFTQGGKKYYKYTVTLKFSAENDMKEKVFEAFSEEEIQTITAENINKLKAWPKKKVQIEWYEDEVAGTANRPEAIRYGNGNKSVFIKVTNPENEFAEQYGAGHANISYSMLAKEDGTHMLYYPLMGDTLILAGMSDDARLEHLKSAQNIEAVRSASATQTLNKSALELFPNAQAMFQRNVDERGLMPSPTVLGAIYRELTESTTGIIATMVDNPTGKAGGGTRIEVDANGNQRVCVTEGPQALDPRVAAQHEAAGAALMNKMEYSISLPKLQELMAKYPFLVRGGFFTVKTPIGREGQSGVYLENTMQDVLMLNILANMARFVYYNTSIQTVKGGGDEDIAREAALRQSGALILDNFTVAEIVGFHAKADAPAPGLSSNPESRRLPGLHNATISEIEAKKITHVVKLNGNPKTLSVTMPSKTVDVSSRTIDTSAATGPQSPAIAKAGTFARVTHEVKTTSGDFKLDDTTLNKSVDKTAVQLIKGQDDNIEDVVLALRIVNYQNLMQSKRPMPIMLTVETEADKEAIIKALIKSTDNLLANEGGAGKVWNLGTNFFVFTNKQDYYRNKVGKPIIPLSALDAAAKRLTLQEDTPAKRRELFYFFKSAAEGDKRLKGYIDAALNIDLAFENLDKWIANPKANADFKNSEAFLLKDYNNPKSAFRKALLWRRNLAEKGLTQPWRFNAKVLVVDPKAMRSELKKEYGLAGDQVDLLVNQLTNSSGSDISAIVEIVKKVIGNREFSEAVLKKRLGSLISTNQIEVNYNDYDKMKGQMIVGVRYFSDNKGEKETDYDISTFLPLFNGSPTKIEDVPRAELEAMLADVLWADRGILADHFFKKFPLDFLRSPDAQTDYQSSVRSDLGVESTYSNPYDLILDVLDNVKRFGQVTPESLGISKVPIRGQSLVALFARTGQYPNAMLWLENNGRNNLVVADVNNFNGNGLEVFVKASSALDQSPGKAASYIVDTVNNNKKYRPDQRVLCIAGLTTSANSAESDTQKILATALMRDSKAPSLTVLGTVHRVAPAISFLEEDMNLNTLQQPSSPARITPFNDFGYRAVQRIYDPVTKAWRAPKDSELDTNGQVKAGQGLEVEQTYERVAMDSDIGRHLPANLVDVVFNGAVESSSVTTNTGGGSVSRKTPKANTDVAESSVVSTKNLAAIVRFVQNAFSIRPTGGDNPKQFPYAVTARHDRSKPLSKREWNDLLGVFAAYAPGTDVSIYASRATKAKIKYYLQESFPTLAKLYSKLTEHWARPYYGSARRADQREIDGSLNRLKGIDRSKLTNLDLETRKYFTTSANHRLFSRVTQPADLASAVTARLLQQKQVKEALAKVGVRTLDAQIQLDKFMNLLDLEVPFIANAGVDAPSFMELNDDNNEGTRALERQLKPDQSTALKKLLKGNFATDPADVKKLFGGNAMITYMTLQAFFTGTPSKASLDKLFVMGNNNPKNAPLQVAVEINELWPGQSVEESAEALNQYLTSLKETVLFDDVRPVLEAISTMPEAVLIKAVFSVYNPNVLAGLWKGEAPKYITEMLNTLDHFKAMQEVVKEQLKEPVETGEKKKTFLSFR